MPRPRRSAGPAVETTTRVMAHQPAARVALVLGQWRWGWSCPGAPGHGPESESRQERRGATRCSHRQGARRCRTQLPGRRRELPGPQARASGSSADPGAAAVQDPAGHRPTAAPAPRPPSVARRVGSDPAGPSSSAPAPRAGPSLCAGRPASRFPGSCPVRERCAAGRRRRLGRRRSPVACDRARPCAAGLALERRRRRDQDHRVPVPTTSVCSSCTAAGTPPMQAAASAAVR